MNIFILDLNHNKNAEYHCDKHVVKMILEHAQLLCSAQHIVNGSAPYKLTHKNHPCAIWVRKSIQNYNWLVALTEALNAEYRFRYNKKEDHKSWQVIKNLPPIELPDIGLTHFAKAISIPEIASIKDPVEAYREYYRAAKVDIATWKAPRSKPFWM